jgi:hypothetical protein
MNKEEINNIVIKHLIEKLSLPDSAYEKAEKRYYDLGEWLCRNDSTVKENDPHVFPQGSFSLGTAIRPLDESEPYDLDLCCKLRRGITKDTHSQKELKEIIGRELNKYRSSRNIKSELESKHRCWRLNYQDDLSFHMDIVPCIPLDSAKNNIIMEAMMKTNEADIANTTSKLTVSITDNRHPYYDTRCNDWNISNPEGYAIWFESRMRQVPEKMFEVNAQVDDVPFYKQKTPLQRVVQLLKRHRDQMFNVHLDVKPISIIITTLAARAYRGEANIADALSNILSTMGNYVNQDKPRVPNPVNPAEDFADRWSMKEYTHLKLEQNFRNWLTQAKTDFSTITSSTDIKLLEENVKGRMSVDLNFSEIAAALKVSTQAIPPTPKKHEITYPARPWSNNRI